MIMDTEAGANKFENLKTYLYRQIKNMIWNRELLPGDKIKQEQLAADLGVSRTPLIKVLERLTTERLVEHKPRRGYYVKKLTLSEMKDIFAIREVVEGVAVREVTEKATSKQIKELGNYFKKFADKWNKELKDEYLLADRKFHARLIEIAGNDILKDINEMFNIYRFSYQKGLMRDPDETLPEHLAIIEKIEEGDAWKAQILMMKHMEKSRQNMEKAFAENVNEDRTIDWN